MKHITKILLRGDIPTLSCISFNLFILLKNIRLMIYINIIPLQKTIVLKKRKNAFEIKP